MKSDHDTSEIVEAEGHLIDSRLMTEILDTVVKHGGAFEVLEFTIGRTNDEYSRLRMRVNAPSVSGMEEVLEELLGLGCRVSAERDASLEVVTFDGCAPEDFYSTSNHHTWIRHDGRWLEVERQRMDAAVVVEDGRAACRKLRDLRVGQRVVCGVDGIRVVPEFRERDRHGFAFMTTGVSSERHVETTVVRIADMIRSVKDRAGASRSWPVRSSSTPGRPGHFCDLIRRGYVDVLLAGNASRSTTSRRPLRDVARRQPRDRGAGGGRTPPSHAGDQHDPPRRHRAGVRAGVLRSGIMFECVERQVPYVLAGSIRDDGPLPDTIMDLVEAQDRYAAELADVKVAVILSTMLHGIGVGNMLPSWVKVVCVDINPSVVTKLVDRGSAQTIGVVTDTGLFVHQLAARLGE